MTDEELEKLVNGLHQTHLIVEDCWYSCPASGECCKDDLTDCDCGADEYNVLLSVLVAAFKASREKVAELQAELSRQQP